MNFLIELGDEKEDVEIVEENGQMYAKVGKARHRIEPEKTNKNNIQKIRIGNSTIEFGWRKKGNEYDIVIEGINYHLSVHDKRFEKFLNLEERKAVAQKGYLVKAPIPGLVLEVNVKTGDKVGPEDSLLILEAMKLENEIRANHEGLVKKVNVKKNTPVDKGQVLVVLD